MIGGRPLITQSCLDPSGAELHSDVRSDEDLRAAALRALECEPEACREFALNYSWENSARQFIGHVRKVATGNSHGVETAMTVGETVAG